MNADNKNETITDEEHQIGYRKNWNPYQHYKDEDVAQAYDNTRFTSLSGRVFSRLENRCLGVAFASLRPNSLIPDVPCGTGRLAEVLLGLGHRVVGMNISDAILAVARRKLKRFEDRFTTEVKPGSFNVTESERVVI